MWDMKLIPRGLASLSFASLALAAVPGPAPVPMIPAPTPGGWTHQDPDSAGVRAAATYAVETLSPEFGRQYVVEHIASAQSQVVAGTDYRLAFRMAEVQDEILGERKDCTAVVWSRPWTTPSNVLVSYTCQSEDGGVDLD